MAVATVVAAGQEVRRVPVTVFGDGDPYNGIEDSREPVMGGRVPGALRPNAGALECDGEVRGTAMVVDTRDLAPGLPGVVLATAAHVLYDLEAQRRFRHCDFHFMALVALDGYRAQVELDRSRLGDFDPSRATADAGFGEGDWAFLYVPRPWRRYRPEDALPARAFSFTRSEEFRQSGGEIQLVALDAASGTVSLSRDCNVVESAGGDLGGGAWPGQLLDDCDSGGGASGGGIVAVLEGRAWLVGIRTGSHWSGQVFPAGDYPAGPPDGSLWDPRYNTNFARALDVRLLKELESFARGLERKAALSTGTYPIWAASI
ncbi:MAG: hypothetical protein PVF46_03410 [Lysobacterales bacterium]